MEGGGGGGWEWGERADTLLAGFLICQQYVCTQGQMFSVLHAVTLWTYCLIQTQCTDTGPAGHSADPVTPGA